MPKVLSKPQVLKKMKKTEATCSQAARPPLGGGGPAFQPPPGGGPPVVGCCFSASGAAAVVVAAGCAARGEDFSEEAREGEGMPVAVDWSERFPSLSVEGPWVVRSAKALGGERVVEAILAVDEDWRRSESATDWNCAKCLSLFASLCRGFVSGSGS